MWGKIQKNLWSLKKCKSIIFFLQSMTSNCHAFFQKKKLRKSVIIWEHLPKRYHFWTITKKEKKSVTIWGHGLCLNFLLFDGFMRSKLLGNKNLIFWWKLKILVKSLNFGQKSQFWSNIKIFNETLWLNRGPELRPKLHVY